MKNFKAISPPVQKGHYVYLLECRDGTLYTGYTTEVKRRVTEHNRGEGAIYTRGRRPVKLVYYQDFKSKSRALQLEYQIKQYPRSCKEAIIRGEKAITD